MSRSWRDHPRLAGRFHEGHPDDVQVIVHNGGPRLGGVAAEVVWVRITGSNGDTFTGTVLNQPKELATVSMDSVIRFKVPTSGELPLMVTEKYLAERSEWIIYPCDRCGLTELFDAPSDLLRVVFPQDAGQLEAKLLTAVCGWCGGTQLVQRVGTEAVEWSDVHEPKRWWKFWR